jgi:hypothetical protein
MNDQPQVQCQVTIGAPVGRVWAVVQDSTLLPQWMPNVAHTVITTVQLEYHYQAKGWLGRLLNRFLIKPQWQPLCLDMLGGLKAFTEAR